MLAAAPGDVIPVAEARRTAKTGDTVSLAGYIGGRAEPFTEGRAVFLLADSEAAPACTDACAVPWDACCTPRETITANSATVQVVDAGGMPLKVGLEGRDGLKPGATVTVVGKVREAGDAVMIVDATGLWVASAQ
jgi:hypothetical protein